MPMNQAGKTSRGYEPCDRGVPQKNLELLNVIWNSSAWIMESLILINFGAGNEMLFLPNLHLDDE